MYVPPAFREDDLAALPGPMREARLANLVTATAEGLVATRMGGDVAGIALPPTLTGTARCAGGALQIPLVRHRPIIARPSSAIRCAQARLRGRHSVAEREVVMHRPNGSRALADR